MSLPKTCWDTAKVRFEPQGRIGSGFFSSGGASDHTRVGVASLTRVLTRRGLVPSSDLIANDWVADGRGGWITLAAVIRVTTDIGSDRVCIPKGALGGGLPSADLEVGPSTRLRLRSPMAARLVGEEAVLISAESLVGRLGITRIRGRSGDVSHLVFEHHGYVLAEDVVVEAFVPETSVLESLPGPVHDEVLAALPKLRYEGARAAYDADAPELNDREARQILAEPSTFGAVVSPAALQPSRVSPQTAFSVLS